jgi:hypothetical protein
MVTHKKIGPSYPGGRITVFSVFGVKGEWQAEPMCLRVCERRQLQVMVRHRLPRPVSHVARLFIMFFHNFKGIKNNYRRKVH